MKFLKKKNLWRLPSIIAALVMAVPIIVVVSSALKVNAGQWVDLWQGRLPNLLFSSFLLVTTVTFGSLLLGSILVWLTERTDLPGRQWIRPLLMAPLIIPCYIIAVCYIGFLGVNGMFERMLEPIWLNIRIPSIYGFGGAAWILIIGTYPYVYTILSASIRQLDPTISEAAKCLGAHSLKRFFAITLPLLTPAFVAGMILVALYVLSDFGVVNLLRYNTFVNAIYEQMSGRYDFRIASALSLVLVFLTLSFLVIQEATGGRKCAFTTSPRVGRLRLYSLGIYQLPAYVFCVIVIIIGLVIPFGMLIYWCINSLGDQGTSHLWRIPLTELLKSGINSVSVSAVAATIAVAISILLAYWTVRYKDSKMGWVISWLSQSGIALPGVLIALGLTLAFNQSFPGLSYSILAIVLAFIIHYFAQGYQVVRAGLLRVSKNFDDSARILGASSVQTFWSVTRPLMMSSIWAGWILIFLSSMRELPASLLLRPAGFDTLTVKVWNAASEGFYEQAAQPALILVMLTLPLIFIVLYRQGDIYAHD